MHFPFGLSNKCQENLFKVPQESSPGAAYSLSPCFWIASKYLHGCGKRETHKSHESGFSQHEKSEAEAAGGETNTPQH